ncbi:MAG: hypothetical protein JWO11_3929 [Nocardioides sp.]|nr:hypothetical protein [Nocardioides sp.]
MSKYSLATAPKKDSRTWEQHDPMTWDEVVAWLDLANPADHKECGGYVLGELDGGRRRKDTVVSRSAVALDADTALPSFALDSAVTLGCSLAMYTTYSHRPESPRFRLLAPLSRDVTPDEYRLIAAALMEEMGRDQFDEGSTEPERLMFRPSTQGHYRFREFPGEPLDADEWLRRAKEMSLDQSPDAPAFAPYEGPEYAELTDTQQTAASTYLQRQIDLWKGRLAEAADWPEGERDSDGRGWEGLAKDSAWALARLAATPWVGWDEDQARDCYAEILPDEFAANEKCGKWLDGIVAKAAARGAFDPPPWESDFGPATNNEKPSVDVTNDSYALDWLEAEVGRGRLSGVFRRAQELVHTPRIGEHGYVAPKDDRDSNGPAQVRRIEALELARRIDHSYSVFKQRAAGPLPSVFPQSVAGRAASAPDLLSNARDLLGVTHTPVVRRDGSILDVPGYDDESGMLYLPDPSLVVANVSGEPSPSEVAQAGKLLLDVVADFPFVTPHDRANYLGALLTPLLRPVVPPPYKLIAIGAPQRGSGKTLLAWIMREVHGGVFKSEMPTNDDELRKFVTSTLDATTGPVVQFDNVTGVLKSSVLDGLLTSAEWSDRLLGKNEVANLTNDRLWVVTGNNVHIGGDLERRTLWVTINANMERPEERTAFTIPDLESWVRTHRGDLLWALLTVIRAWVVAGRPTPPQATTDSFGLWVAVLRGILAHASLGDTVGEVGHADSAQSKADPEDEEWAAFLAAVRRVFGPEVWTTRELLDRTSDVEEPLRTGRGEAFKREWLLSDELPGDLVEKYHRSPATVTKSLGRWLGHRDQRWAGGLSVQKVGDRRDSKLWRVVDTSELG